MGRLHRRFIRTYDLTVVNKLTVRREPTIAYAGKLTATHSEVVLPAGVVVTGYVHANIMKVDINDTAQVTLNTEALRIEMWAHAGALVHTINCIQVNNYIEAAFTGDYYFVRLTENGPVIVKAMMYLSIGGATDITDLFFLGGTKTAWSAAVNPPGGVALGRVALNVAGVQRYVQLYT